MTTNQAVGPVPRYASTVKAGDPEHRAGDVDGVRPQRRHRTQKRPERQRQRRHQRRHEDDDQRQDDEVDVGAGRGVEPEEDLAGVAGLDVELGAVDQEDGHEQQGRERATGPAAGARRPSRIPTPIPRKLAISRKLLKNPTYLTLAGIQRISSSSTNRSVALVRNSRIGVAGERPRPRGGAGGDLAVGHPCGARLSPASAATSTGAAVLRAETPRPTLPSQPNRGPRCSIRA